MFRMNLFEKRRDHSITLQRRNRRNYGVAKSKYTYMCVDFEIENYMPKGWIVETTAVNLRREGAISSPQIRDYIFISFAYYKYCE